MNHCPHIVVVEDEATQRRLLVDYLTRQNFRVSGVDGGASLRKLAERELPTLVLLDVGLPGEDGFALATLTISGVRPALLVQSGSIPHDSRSATCSASPRLAASRSSSSNFGLHFGSWTRSRKSRIQIFSAAAVDETA